MTLSLAFFYAPSRRNSTASHVVCLVDCGVRSDVQSAGYTDLVLVRAVCVRISTRPRRAYQSGSKTRGFWWRICSGPPRLPLTRFIPASRARSRRRRSLGSSQTAMRASESCAGLSRRETTSCRSSRASWANRALVRWVSNEASSEAAWVAHCLLD